jgi:hypothetical protein
MGEGIYLGVQCVKVCMYIEVLHSFYFCIPKHVAYTFFLRDQPINTPPATKLNQFHPDPARKLSTNLYDIYHCSVYSEKIPDDGQRNCPKHVEFHSKINLRN